MRIVDTKSSMYGKIPTINKTENALYVNLNISGKIPDFFPVVTHVYLINEKCPYIIKRHNKKI